MEMGRQKLLDLLLSQGAVKSNEIEALTRAVEETDQEAIDAALAVLKSEDTPADRVADEIFKSRG